MIRSFGDETTRDVFDGLNTRSSRKVSGEIHDVARRKLDYINAAAKLEDLKVPPGNRLEPLKGDRTGFYSIRINVQWRIVFKWSERGADQVMIQDYH